jgi:hypothetical protein
MTSSFLQRLYVLYQKDPAISRLKGENKRKNPSHE